jgi:TMEM175 potassium channel family protein
MRWNRRGDAAGERRIVRFRSVTTLCVFGVAAAVALKFPLIGLGMCCCCLIVYLKPEAPGAETQQSPQ